MNAVEIDELMAELDNRVERNLADKVERDAMREIYELWKKDRGL
jgi:hypothetical protein